MSQIIKGIAAACAGVIAGVLWCFQGDQRKRNKQAILRSLLELDSPVGGSSAYEIRRQVEDQEGLRISIIGLFEALLDLQRNEMIERGTRMFASASVDLETRTVYSITDLGRQVVSVTCPNR